jgi:hypothetical protein
MQYHTLPRVRDERVPHLPATVLYHQRVRCNADSALTSARAVEGLKQAPPHLEQVHAPATASTQTTASLYPSSFS